MLDRELELIHCPDEEILGRLFRFYDVFLERAAHISYDTALERFRRCPSAFYCVIRRGAGPDRELAGYFVLLPLLSQCAEAIARGAIRSGREIEPHHLACGDDLFHAVYLSVVCAVGRRAQSGVIRGVIVTLRRLHFTRGVSRLYVRAATAAGARVLTRLSATPFEADGRIHSIDLGDYPLMSSTEARV
ncbi:MAG: hypothetical protein JWN02_1786 [Acidobacteria bacterium]|nr:hypothetical protein [Acidobacteriota bacterium]